MYKKQPIKCVNNVNFFKSYITSSGTQNCIFTNKYSSKIKCKSEIMETGIKITKQNKEAVATFLNLLLANEYILYTKTRTAHWNVEGSNYFELHVFLENNYNELDAMIDEIAEQIRLLGRFALSSIKDFVSASQISDDNNDFNNPGQIFESLINNHESIIHIIQQEIYPISNKFKDIVLTDFLTKLMTQHENMARMLKSFLSNNKFDSAAYNYDRASQLIDWQD